MKNNVQLLQGKQKKLQTNLNFASCLSLRWSSEEDCRRLRCQAEEESTHEATGDDDVLLHEFCSLETEKKSLRYDFTNNWATRTHRTALWNIEFQSASLAFLKQLTRMACENKMQQNASLALH